MNENINIAPKLGRSRYTLGALAAVLVGLFMANFFVLPFLLSSIIIILIIIGIYFYHHNANILLTFIILLGFIGGLTYWHWWDYRESHKNLPYGQITLTALVSERPSIKNSTADIIVNYRDTKILIQTSRFPEFKYGDVIKISGELTNPENIRPYENFDYGNYLLKKGIRGQIKNPEKIEKVGEGGNAIIKNIYLVGEKFAQMISKLLSEPYTAFQLGLLIGEKTNIPDSLMTAFNRTGTTHIVAVSGFNITIIISTIGLLLAYFSRKASAIGTLLTIIFFVILCGAGASVLRAALLASLAIFARLSGRKPYWPIVTILTAVILLLFNPYALKNDISFQLSFLAFIGLVTISPMIEKIKIITCLPPILKTPLTQTLGAQVLVLPILLYNFGTLSLIAPLANVLILTFVPWAMLLGFLTGMAGFIYFKLGVLIANFAYALLRYIIVVVEKLSAMSWAAVTIDAHHWWWIPLYYVIIILIMQKLKIKNLPAGRQGQNEISKSKISNTF